MQGITFKQLRVFTVLARVGTLGKAGEELFITKAAVSMALQELESRLHKKLFDRIKNRLVLNINGDRLLPLALELLQRSNDIGNLFNTAQSPLGQLNIGASNSIMTAMMPKIMAGFGGCAKRSLVGANSWNLAQQIKDLTLDIAFVESEVYAQELHREHWLTDCMQVVVARSHPLAGKRCDIADLEHQQWILREQGSGTREQFERHIAPSVSNYQVSMEITDNETIIMAVLEGIGIGFLSDYSTQRWQDSGDLAVVELPDKISRKLYMLFHREKYQSTLLTEFIDYARAWAQREMNR